MNVIIQKSALKYACIFTRYLVFAYRAMEQNIDVHLTETDTICLRRLITSLTISNDEECDDVMLDVAHMFFTRKESSDILTKFTYIATAAIGLDSRGVVGPTSSFSQYGSAMVFCCRVTVLKYIQRKSQRESRRELE